MNNTPGPWRIRNHQYVCDDNKSGMIAFVYKKGDFPNYIEQELAANAALIASSPDLYDALLLSLESMSRIDGESHAGLIVADAVKLCQAVLGRIKQEALLS